MREITFRVEQEHGKPLRARSIHPELQISTASLEELHPEAREALIQHYGVAHGAYRVRLQRSIRHIAATSRVIPSPRRQPSCAVDG
jgi:hypothetical protein